MNSWPLWRGSQTWVPGIKPGMTRDNRIAARWSHKSHENPQFIEIAARPPPQQPPGPPQGPGLRAQQDPAPLQGAAGLAQVSAKWEPVRRQGHAPLKPPPVWPTGIFT